MGSLWYKDLHHLKWIPHKPCVRQLQASLPDSQTTAHRWLLLSCCGGNLTPSMLTKMAKRVKERAFTQDFFPSSPAVHSNDLNGHTRISEKQKISKDTRAMWTRALVAQWHTQFWRSLLDVYQNVRHCCHIHMPVTPTQTYEDGCWMAHVGWQL